MSKHIRWIVATAACRCLLGRHPGSSHEVTAVEAADRAIGSGAADERVVRLTAAAVLDVGCGVVDRGRGECGADGPDRPGGATARWP